MSEPQLAVSPCTELQVLDTLCDIESKSASPRSFLTRAIDSLLEAMGLDGGVALVRLQSAPGMLTLVRGSAGPLIQSHLADRLGPTEGRDEDSVQVTSYADAPRCWISVPVVGKRAFLGRLVLGAVQARDLDRWQISLLRAAGRRLGLTLDHLGHLMSDQTRIAQLAALNRVSTAIMSTLDEDQVYATLLSQMRQVLGFDWAGLALLDEKQRAVIHLSMGQAPDGYRVGTEVTPEQAPLGWTSQYERALLRTQIATHQSVERFDDDRLLQAAGLCTDMTVPLFHGERCIGAISLASQDAQAYTTADLQILRQAGEYAAAGLENARLYQDERHRAQQLEQISVLVHSAAASLDTERQLQVIGDAQSLFPRGRLAVGFLHGDQLRWHPADTRIPRELDSVIETTFATARSQSRIDNPLEPSIITAPLKISEEVTGIIVLCGRRGESLDPSEQQVLETLAAQTSVTLENAQLFEMTLRQGVLLEQRANRLAHILETSYDILRLRSRSQDLWTRVCHIAQDALGFRIAAIYGLDNQHTLSLRALVGSANRPSQQTCPAAEFDRLLVSQSRISHSYHVRHSDESSPDAPSALRCLARAGFSTSNSHPTGTLLVPIEAPDGQVVGYLALGEPRDSDLLSLETIQAVEIFVNQVAIAREHSRLFAALEQRLSQARRVNELAALHRLSTAIASSLEAEQIQIAAATEIAATLRADTAAIWLLSPQEGVCPPTVVHREQDPDLRIDDALIRPEGIAEAIQAGSPLLLNQSSSQGTVLSALQRMPDPGTVQVELEGEIQSALLAPIAVRGQKIGVLGAFSHSRERFDRQDLALLDSMASTIALAIENARLYAESKAFAQELAESQAQLVQGARLAAIGQLAASIAHEINNPLQAVQSCIYLIADGAPQDDPNVKYVEIARRELDRIARIVGRMLDFDHPGREARQATNVNALIEDVLALVGKRLQHSEITVRTDLDPDLPEIHAVSDHIKQVLLNLFLNALEAMPQGGTLRVETAIHDALGDGLTITIQDDGIGIQPDDLNHLFEPFHTTKPSGTGLGLSISYDIIAQHGGNILVESEPEQGTTFVIQLPTSTGAQAWNKS